MTDVEEIYLSPFIQRCKDELFIMAQWDITRNNRLEIIKERKNACCVYQEKHPNDILNALWNNFPKEIVEAKYLNML